MGDGIFYDGTTTLIDSEFNPWMVCHMASAVRRGSIVAARTCDTGHKALCPVSPICTSRLRLAFRITNSIRPTWMLRIALIQAGDAAFAGVGAAVDAAAAGGVAILAAVSAVAPAVIAAAVAALVSTVV